MDAGVVTAESVGRPGKYQEGDVIIMRNSLKSVQEAFANVGGADDLYREYYEENPMPYNNIFNEHSSYEALLGKKFIIGECDHDNEEATAFDVYKLIPLEDYDYGFSFSEEGLKSIFAYELEIAGLSTGMEKSILDSDDRDLWILSPPEI